MAIHASAKAQNIQASVAKYIQDSLQGTDGLTAATVTAGTADFLAANIWWQFEDFSPGDVDYFLRPVIRRGAAEYFAAGEAGNPGSIVRFTFFLDVFIKREYARQQNDAWLLPAALDLVRGSFKGTDSITVKNYDGDGGTTLGKLWFRGLEPHEPAEAEWLSGGWMVSAQWVEQDVNA